MRLKFVYILLLVMQPLIVICQSRWTNIYYGEKDALADYFIEYYDHGYLIAGRHGSSYAQYGWLIKTDINGQILWEKTFGEEDSRITILSIDNNNSGKLYCTGITNYYDESRDPIIIKLDSCGEKEWCRVFYTPGNMDYSNLVQATDDGGCVAVLMYTGYDPSGNIDRLCLSKFSGEGELLWKQCYNSTDTLIMNQDADHLYLTNDKGFIVSGICHYKTPEPPHILYNKPYFLKTDSMGNFQWETVVFKDMGALERGHGWTTTINPSGQFYYSSISHYKYNPYSSSPALLKMDLNGNVLGVFDLVSGYMYGGLAWSQFINDTILAASAGWGNDLDSARQYAILIDTLGNIVDSTLISNDIYGPKLQVVYDQKLVYMYNTYQNNQFDVHLRKLNQNLEDDTFYTFPFHYDTLCPYPIASDTIVQDDCVLIVGIEEEDGEMGRDGDGERMELFPNPASDRINCRLSVVDCRYSIFIYDMFGRKQEEIQIPKGQKEIQIDVSDYPQGIYIAVLRSEREMLDRKKFVVQ